MKFDDDDDDGLINDGLYLNQTFVSQKIFASTNGLIWWMYFVSMMLIKMSMMMMIEINKRDNRKTDD